MSSMCKWVSGIHVCKLMIHSNSLKEYKERWAGPWVERYAHMGGRTTQRVEGAHWSIKQIMSTAGRLIKLFYAINLYLQKHVRGFSWITRAVTKLILCINVRILKRIFHTMMKSRLSLCLRMILDIQIFACCVL